MSGDKSELREVLRELIKRSLAQQLKYCLSQANAIGHSKRAEKRQAKIDIKFRKKQKTRIYSNGRSDALKDTAKDFARWMKIHFPDVYRVVDIKTEHVQTWLDDKREKGVSQRTLDEYKSRMVKLDKIVRETYGHSSKFSEGLIVPQSFNSADEVKIRDAAMTREDLELLKESFLKRGARTDAVIAIELTSRSGLRIGECAILTGKDINLENRTLRVNGKNGKIRHVPIQERDMGFYTVLKENAGEGQVCSHVMFDRHKGGKSLDRAIRREMQRIGIDNNYPDVTTDHAIRKLYATERMMELRGVEASNPRSNKAERVAWSQVQQELGHGEDLRMALYKTYVKT